MEFWRGFIIAFVLVSMVLAYVFLAGCAHAPYYSGTAAQHITESIPCDRDNCGELPE